MSWPFALSTSLASPAGDYLRDPLGAFQTVLAHLRDFLFSWGPIAGPLLAVVTAAAVIARRRWRCRFHESLVTDARLITVLAPPTVDPSGAITVWSNLVGLLRPGWRRRFGGQPHLAFELTFTDDGVQIRLWVPGVVPPGMVERAIEAAWPGAHTRTTPAKPPIPTAAAPGRRIEAVGGELRLARSEALPIRTEHPADPIRALLGAPVGLGPHERACVQILARPVAGHRVTKARRAAKRVHAGNSVNLAGRLLDIVTPGKTAKPSSSARTPGLDRQTSLEFAAQDRAVVEKLRQNQFETRIRYAVATTVPEHATTTEVQAVREVLRGRGHAIASAFAAFSEHNYFRRVRLRLAPVQVLAERRFGKGDLLSIPELAALAHLPIDEATPGLQRAGAKAVPPPPGIATAGDLIKPLGLVGLRPRPAGRPARRRRASPPARPRRHRLRQVGAAGQPDPRRRRGRPRRGRRRPQGRPRHRRPDPAFPTQLGEKVVLFDADSRARPPVLNPLEGGETGPRGRQPRQRLLAGSTPRSGARAPTTSCAPPAHPAASPAAPHPGRPAEAAHRPGVPATGLRPGRRDVLRGFWSWYDELTDASRSQVIAR